MKVNRKSFILFAEVKCTIASFPEHSKPSSAHVITTSYGNVKLDRVFILPVVQNTAIPRR